MLGERIHERLETLGMTQTDLARKAGLSTGYVSDLVNGKRGKRLGGDVALRLSKALRVKPVFLLSTFAYATNGNANERKSE